MTQTSGISIKNIILTGMFTAIICVLSQVIIPLQPVPFSLSLLAIYLTGALLEPRYALSSALAYVILGAFGLPVFAGFAGGPHILTGMTGGFIMAYPVMALVTSVFYKLSKKFRSVLYIGLPVLGMTLSLIICYLLGTLWFCFVTKSSAAYALSVCVLPFIVFDLIKILMAVAIAEVLRKAAVKILA